MTLAFNIFAICAIFGLPVPIVLLTRRNRILGALGAIACCYLLGFAFSAIGLSGVSYDKNLTTTIAYILVALSIPLILFGIDLRQVKKLTRNTAVGFSLCIVSVVLVAAAMYFITRKFFPSVQLSAMIVGLYTGGTPNMNAIGAAMGAESNLLSAANLSDTVVGGIYFLLLVSVAPKCYRFLLDRKGGKRTYAVSSGEEKKGDDYSFGFSFRVKKRVLHLFGGFLLSVACLGIGVLLEFLIEGTIGENLLYILLSVSVLGVAFSFLKPVREIKGQYTLGMYLILMFSLALSMSIDWSVFLTDILPTLAFFAGAQVTVIVVHALLCRLFRVDGDTALITSTAGRADLIAPGVICGALGLAVGTLLGIGVGQCLILLG